MDAQQRVTTLLAAVRAGEPDALDRLLPLVYEELRRIARRQLRREQAGHTLSTTALVHEAYFRLVDQVSVGWGDRGHFYAVAAQAMRRILVDHARSRRTAKRGGDRRRIPLEMMELPVEDRAELLVALDEALTRLSALDQRQARVVECRYFGGLTEEETAAALGVTARTVRRDWVKAKGWLYRELTAEPPG
jgi:RNA polymerase sigma factor (TIGR02999 family)